MSFQRGIDGSEPIRPESVGSTAGQEEIRPAARSMQMASGTLACPHCDAPVALTERAMRPADELACPYCAHAGAVRTFLSLERPTRPTRVAVRLAERF